MSAEDNDNDSDSAKPPLLDYPPVPFDPEDRDTESWFEVGRAMLIVFGVLAFLFVVTFGLCGVLARGCG
jgi:hypothetical protein